MSSSDITLKDIILTSKKWYYACISKWVKILLSTLLGSIIGLGYALYKKDIYTATCTFVLEDTQNGGALGQYGGLASMIGIDMGANGGGVFQGDNILELYKSTLMITKTLLSPANTPNNQLLIDRYLDFSGLRTKLRVSNKNDLVFYRDQKKFNRFQDSVLDVIVKDLNKGSLLIEKPDKKLSIIKVEVKSTDEIFAKEFTDQIVKNVNDFFIQTKTKKSLQNLEVLQHQTDSVKAVLNDAIYKTTAVSDATPNLNTTRQILRVPAQKSQLSAEANKAILVELVKNLELAKVSLRKETPLIQIIDKPSYPLDIDKQSKIKSALIGGIVVASLFVLIIIFKIIIADSLK